MPDLFSEIVLKLSPQARKRKRLGRKPISREKRPELTKDELVNFLLKNKIKSANKLRKIRKAGDPKVYDYVLAFDSWKNARQAAYGTMSDWISKPISSDEELIRLVLENNIRTSTQYKQKQKERPDIYPSIKKIFVRWGRWSAFKHHVQSYSIKRTIEEYMKLSRRLRRIPTSVDCRQENLVLDKAIATLGEGKKHLLDKFVFHQLMENEIKDWGTNAGPRRDS
jgi:hypothetical protein